MSDSSIDVQLGMAIDEYLTLCRNGATPDINSFASQHPQLREKLLQLLPSMNVIEAANPSTEKQSVEKGLPDRIGDHQILREVGRGGMGIVYEAIDLSLKRRVALKVLLRNALLQTDQIERFRREAQAVARLNHPNIIPIFSVGESADSPFFAMQYVDGASLNDVIHQLKQETKTHPESDRPRESTRPALSETIARSLVGRADSTGDISFAEVTAPTGTGSDRSLKQSSSTSSSLIPGSGDSTTGKPYFREVARIGVQIARAIQFAHDHGILHRDIKPANIMLDQRNHVWVADFGLAKSNDSNLTETGQLVGTLRYLSPERLHGEDNELCDVYALGATLYELTTLRSAYPNPDHAALLTDILHSEPIGPRLVNDRIPRNLETIIRKAMAREPSLRYQTAGQLADDLERMLENRPLHARPVSMTTRSMLWIKRNPLPSFLIAALTFLCTFTVIGAVIFSLYISNKDRELGSAEKREQYASEVAKERLYKASISEAHQSLTNRKAGRNEIANTALSNAIEVQQELWPESEQHTRQLRQTAIAIGSTFDLVRGRTVQLGDSEHYAGPSAAFNSDLSKIAVNNDKYQLAILDTDTGNPIQNLGGTWNDVNMEFSANDRFLIARGNDFTADGYRLFVWDFEQNKATINRLDNGISSEHNFSISRDARQLVFVGDDSEIHLADPSTGEIQFSGQLPKRPRFLKLNQSGSQLLVAYKHDIEMYVVSGQKIHLDKLDKTFSHEWYPLCAAWHPWGAYFAIGMSNGDVCIWRANKEQQPQMTFRGHRREVKHLAFNGDGSVLLSRGSDNTTRFWNTRAGNLILNAGPGGSRFSRDGSKVGFESFDLEFRIDEIAPTLCRCLTTSARTDKEVSAISISPDGRFLVWGSESSRLSVWDSESNVVGRLTDKYYQAISVSFAADSNSKLMAYSHPRLETFQFRTTINDGLLAVSDQTSSLVEESDAWLSVERIDNEKALLADGSSVLRIVNLKQPGGDAISIDTPRVAEQVAVSLDGQFAACVSRQHEFLMLIDLQNQTYLRETKVGLKPNISLAPDHSLIAVTYGSTLSIRDTTNLRPIKEIKLEVQDSGTPCFSNAGELLAVAAGQEVLVYETSNFDEVAKLRSPDGGVYTSQNFELPTGIAFSPDDAKIAVGTRSDCVHVWDVGQILSSNFLSTSTDK